MSYNLIVLMVSLVAPIVATALVAAFGAWFQDWRQNQSSIHARQRALTQSSERVAFIEAWIRAYEVVAPEARMTSARERALDDLERAYVAVDEAFSRPSPQRRPFTPSRFLIRDRPVRGWARFWRSAFYLGLLWAAVWAAVGWADTAARGYPAFDMTITLVVVLIVGVIPAWLLRTFAVWAAERQRESSPLQRPMS